MAFSIRSFKVIANDILEYFAASNSSITDLNKSSDLRIMLESHAQELARWYTHVAVGIQEAIETLAYTTFDRPAKGAVAAYGEATFTKTSVGTLTIPLGTKIGLPGTTKYYTTTSSGSIVGSASVTLKIEAVVPGFNGNTGIGTITDILGGQFNDNTLTVSNAGVILTGRDAETAEERRQNFRTFILSLPRSTKNALEIGVRTTILTDNFGNVTEEVPKSQVLSPSGGVAVVSTTSSTAIAAGSRTITVASFTGIANGMWLSIDTSTNQEYVLVTAVNSGASTFTATFAKAHSGTYKISAVVTIFIDNGLSSTTSTTLVTEAQKIIDGYTDINGILIPGFKAAGIPTVVVAATRSSQTAAATLTLSTGYTLSMLSDAVKDAIATYFSELQIGDPFILIEYKSRIMGVRGVADITSSTPSGNLTAVDGTVYTLNGTPTVS